MSDFLARIAEPSDLSYIDSIQKKNAECLAFYPTTVLEREIANRRVIVTAVRNQHAGYLWHGAFNIKCPIHQAVIQHDLRGALYGAGIVRFFTERARSAGVCFVGLRCGSDIEANAFWRAMGFICEAVVPGGGRRMRDINVWTLCLSPSLFQSEVEPSTKPKSAAAWTASDARGTGNRFVRGKQLLKFREAL